MKSFPVLGDTTALYTARLVDEVGDPIPGALLETLTLTVTAILGSNNTPIVNGRNEQNVLNANGVTVSEVGALRWELVQEDTAFVGSSRVERHRVEFAWSWGEEEPFKHGKHVFYLKLLREP